MTILGYSRVFARNLYRKSRTRSKLDHLCNHTSYVVSLTVGLLRERMFYTEPSLNNFQHGLYHHGNVMALVNCNASSVSFLKSVSGLSEIHRNKSTRVDSLIECAGSGTGSNTENNVRTGDFQVIENFISIHEQSVLLKEIERHFKGARYEYDHWDDAIHGYRETEKSKWSDETQNILRRVRNEAFDPEATQLPLVHVLDLAEDGYIKPHVDSIKFCGPTIAGLSLISSSVVKLVNEKDDTQWIKALLPPGSLYIIRNKIRYDYTHEILKDDESVINGERIKRGRRVSVMFRDHPIGTEDDPQ